MIDDTTLEARVKRLEDINEIKALKYAYAYHANIQDGKGGDLDAFSKLFTDTAEWDVGLGHFIGPRAIKEAMQGVTTQWQAVMHLVLCPVITVSGDSATGMWSGLFPFISPGNAKPIWSSLIYREEYVRTNQGWRFQSVKVTPVFQSPEFYEIYEEFLKKNALV